MAYPGGTHCIDERVAKVIRENTGVKYARTTTSTFNFDLQDDLIMFNPTVYHHMEWDKMEELAKEFIDKYFELRAPMKRKLEEILKQAREQGYVETYTGRPCNLQPQEPK